VLIATTPIDVLLPRLRELGAAPVVEAADGTVHVARPDQLRARTPRSRRSGAIAQARDTARVSAVVTAIRAGDEAAASRPAGERGQLTPADALAALREAAEARAAVVITYVDNHGTLAERVVEPVRVEGGQLVAHDRRADEVRGFAVHRIREVRPAEG
jgi:predicted DNA-binding transcriptional regulator YafY